MTTVATVTTDLIKSRLADGGQGFHLSEAVLGLMEREAGSVHGWLRRHGYTLAGALVPAMIHHHLLEFINDESDESDGEGVVFCRPSWIGWRCSGCGLEGERHPATDEGADAAGIGMIRHSLELRRCAGVVYLAAGDDDIEQWT